MSGDVDFARRHYGDFLRVHGAKKTTFSKRFCDKFRYHARRLPSKHVRGCIRKKSVRKSSAISTVHFAVDLAAVFLPRNARDGGLHRSINGTVVVSGELIRPIMMIVRPRFDVRREKIKTRRLYWDAIRCTLLLFTPMRIYFLFTISSRIFSICLCQPRVRYVVRGISSGVTEPNFVRPVELLLTCTRCGVDTF